MFRERMKKRKEKWRIANVLREDVSKSPHRWCDEGDGRMGDVSVLCVDE